MYLSDKTEEKIINDFTSKTPEVYNEYIKNRIIASEGNVLDLKRKYAVTVPDLAEIMLYVTPVYEGDYDTADNLNNEEYKAAYERYLKTAENRGEKAVSMNVFLNTVLPVVTKIRRNRDDVNADVFEFFTGDMDSTKDVMEYTDYLSFVGGEPLMIAKQIYDKIFSYALSGADSWEKSLIDDILEEDGLLDKESDVSNDNSDDVADAILSLADIALSLIDKGKIGTSVSRNLYSNSVKKLLKKLKKKL